MLPRQLEDKVSIVDVLALAACTKSLKTRDVDPEHAVGRKSVTDHKQKFRHIFAAEAKLEEAVVGMEDPKKYLKGWTHQPKPSH